MTFKKTIALASVVAGLAFAPSLALSAPNTASATIPAVDQSTFVFTGIYDSEGNLIGMEVEVVTTCGQVGCVD